jgi:dipeptidyl aminopeptidase/acylaminoacyl peptidase
MLLILSFTVPLFAGTDLVPVTEANYRLYTEWDRDKLSKRIMGIRLIPHWLDDDRFWYRYRTNEGIRWYIVDPGTKKKRMLFDLKTITDAVAEHSGDAVTPRRIDPAGVTIDDNGRTARFTAGLARYEYDIPSGTIAFIDSIAPPPDEPRPATSPDGALMVFSRGNNIYVAETANPDGTERPLSSDGTKNVWWAGQTEDTKDGPCIREHIEVHWSEDSNRFAVHRYDFRDTGEMWLIDDLAEPRPTLTTLKVPLPGGSVPQTELWVFDRSADSFIRIDTGRWPDQTLSDLFAPTLYWSRDGSRLYFIRRSRDYLNVDLCASDPFTGETTVLVEERMNDMVYIHDLVELPHLGGFLWWSMRDGWGHLYYYDYEGTLVRQLTKGEFNVDEVIAADEKRELVYFTANGVDPERNPYYRHLYSIGLDGRKMKLLTPEDAEHRIAFAPSWRYFVDTHSRVDIPPVYILRDHSGRKVLELESYDMGPLTEAGWKFPETFSAKAADGTTDLWGVMWKPFDFDPHRKYPIIVRTYPGKQNEFIPRAFSPWSPEGVLAQLGFIVVNFGNRGGTPERGFEYRSFGRGDLRDYPIADKKAVTEELAVRHPFIDIERVGIFGGSSGGYCTATALLTEPDFFKVGVAISGPHDGDIYYNIWHERYNGLRMAENADGSISWEVSSETNIEIADNLRGHLLIVQGSMDHIVHPAHAMRLADALIRSGKRFDFFMVPGAGHGYRERHQHRYLQRLIVDYFAEHLIGDARINVDMFSADPPRP